MRLFGFGTKTRANMETNSASAKEISEPSDISSESLEIGGLAKELASEKSAAETELKAAKSLLEECGEHDNFDLLNESIVLGDTAIANINMPEDGSRSESSGIEQDESVDRIFTDPQILSYAAISFAMPESGGRELAPGRRLAFAIPEEFKNRIVRDVILKHRKGEKYRINIGPDGYDPHGAYSKVEIFNSETGRWEGWADPKGYDPVKFAEPRPSSDPENEVLHDWVAMVGQIKPEAIRVTNVGKHPVNSTSQIHGVDVVFFPEKDDKVISEIEKVYCQGTEFIDIDANKLLPRYGGGSHTEGIYEGAIALNQRGPALYKLGENPGEGVEKDSQSLRIKLSAGEQLAQVEVAVGDTERLDHISPKTNRRTRLGYSKLWVGLKHKDSGTIDWFIKNYNIPPQGIISGAPNLESSLIEDGDELIIEARQDTAYIMGWKISTKKVQP